MKRFLIRHEPVAWGLFFGLVIIALVTVNCGEAIVGPDIATCSGCCEPTP